jgi:hypothetical protein
MRAVGSHLFALKIAVFEVGARRADEPKHVTRIANV